MRTSLELLEAICHETRKGVLETTLNARSGHVGGCLSSVELMVALYFSGVLRIEVRDPTHPDRDRVLVRGHLGPLRYKIFSLLGWIQESELRHYRRLGSILQGHEDMTQVPGVDITPSGSLGMLLSYGVGAAVALKEQCKSSKVYVFLGDGEEQEGNISEAARHAAHLGLNNLVCIIDRNGKQLSHLTSAVDGAVDLSALWEAYAWDVLQISDGHSLPEILRIYNSTFGSVRPVLIIANTIKGKGLVGAVEHYSGYHVISSRISHIVEQGIEQEKTWLREHGYTTEEVLRGQIETLTRQQMKLPSHSLGNNAKTVRLEIAPVFSSDEPFVETFASIIQTDAAEIPSKVRASNFYALMFYLNKLGPTARKRGYFERLYAMNADLVDPEVVTLCGFNTDEWEFIDVGIREQHLLAMAYGIACTDHNACIFVHYGDSLLYRAADQLNVIAQGNGNVVIVGAQSGLSNARNGSTHQSSGQPGLLLTMPGITFLEPADIIDLFNCLNWAFSNRKGGTYIRLHGGDATPLEQVGNRNPNQIDYYVAADSQTKPDIVLVASGLTVRCALEARDLLLNRHGVNARVINVINPKSLDSRFAQLLEDDIPVLTVYNGNAHVLQSAVALSVCESATARPRVIRGIGFNIGTSGYLEELLQHYGLDDSGIARTAIKLVNVLNP